MTTADAYGLDKSSPVPLYIQLKSRILALIESGELSVGDTLPSEAEFREALGVSRPTVRQAVAELAMEGYVTKEQGKGTFVSRPKIEGRFLAKLQSFADEMRSQGLRPSTELLALERVIGDAAANERLGLDPDDWLVGISRLRSADGEPIVFVRSFLPGRDFAALLGADLETNSLYATLETQLGVRITRVTRQIEAINAGASEAELLRVEEGAAVCLVRTVGYAMARPIEYSIAWYRGDKTRFSLELYR